MFFLGVFNLVIFAILTLPSSKILLRIVEIKHFAFKDESYNDDDFLRLLAISVFILYFICSFLVEMLIDKVFGSDDIDINLVEVLSNKKENDINLVEVLSNKKENDSIK